MSGTFITLGKDAPVLTICNENVEQKPERRRDRRKTREVKKMEKVKSHSENRESEKKAGLNVEDIQVRSKEEKKEESAIDSEKLVSEEEECRENEGRKEEEKVEEKNKGKDEDEVKDKDKDRDRDEDTVEDENEGKEEERDYNYECEYEDGEGEDEEEEEEEDDMLFYVKAESAGVSTIPTPAGEKAGNEDGEKGGGTLRVSSGVRPAAEPFIICRRSDPSSLPVIGDCAINWEETVCLNALLHRIRYTLAVAVCVKKESYSKLSIVKRVKKRVFAQPSKRRMDSREGETIITWPFIYFPIDDFEECFGEILVMVK